MAPGFSRYQLPSGSPEVRREQTQGLSKDGATLVLIFGDKWDLSPGLKAGLVGGG